MCSVPKRGIGGSGTSTQHISSTLTFPRPSTSASQVQACSTLSRWLEALAGVPLPIWRSLHTIVFLLLVKLWTRPWRAPSIPLGGLFGWPLHGLPVRACATLGGTLPSVVVLD